MGARTDWEEGSAGRNLCLHFNLLRPEAHISGIVFSMLIKVSYLWRDFLGIISNGNKENSE